MNRITVTAAALAAWLFLPGGALASHTEGPGQGSPRDFAVGTAEGSIGRVSFAAHGGPSPAVPVTGFFHAKGEVVPDVAGEFDLQGPVTCLHVMGNRAGLFYPVRDPEFPEPNGVFVYLEDKGNPTGGDSPDEISFLPVPPALPPPFPPACPPVVEPELDVTSGNIVVHESE